MRSVSSVWNNRRLNKSRGAMVNECSSSHTQIYFRSHNEISFLTDFTFLKKISAATIDHQDIFGKKSTHFNDNQLITSNYLSSEVGDFVLEFADFVRLVHGGRQVALSHLLLVLKSESQSMKPTDMKGSGLRVQNGWAEIVRVLLRECHRWKVTALPQRNTITVKFVAASVKANLVVKNTHCSRQSSKELTRNLFRTRNLRLTQKYQMESFSI